MAESIELPFRMWNQMGPRKHIFDGMDIGATWQIQLNRQYAAAMRPFCQITLITLTESTSKNVGDGGH